MKFSGQTRLESYRCVKDMLLGRDIQEAEREAKLLIARVMDIEIIDIFLYPEAAVTDEQAVLLRRLLRRRMAGQPLQYAMHTAYFMGLQFYVDKRVLIPRPETELLVEKALEALDGQDKSVLDLCTGSGCIAVSIAAMNKNACVFASDISAGALTVAKINARLLHMENRITFIKSDLLENISGRFDVIVSNPPYISQSEYEALPSHIRLFEPREALWADDDGLLFYRSIAKHARDHLNEGGTLLLEIGAGQANDVAALLKEQGFDDVLCDKDYGGHDRVMIAK
jgi:release factor glutamine methyltransferase